MKTNGCMMYFPIKSSPFLGDIRSFSGILKLGAYLQIQLSLFHPKRIAPVPVGSELNLKSLVPTWRVSEAAVGWLLVKLWGEIHNSKTLGPQSSPHFGACLNGELAMTVPGQLDFFKSLLFY